MIDRFIFLAHLCLVRSIVPFWSFSRPWLSSDLLYRKHETTLPSYVAECLANYQFPFSLQDMQMGRSVLKCFGAWVSCMQACTPQWQHNTLSFPNVNNCAGIIHKSLLSMFMLSQSNICFRNGMRFRCFSCFFFMFVVDLHACLPSFSHKPRYYISCPLLPGQSLSSL